MSPPGAPGALRWPELLAAAWARRRPRDASESPPRAWTGRWFHGPTEPGVPPAARAWAIDALGDWTWVTSWESDRESARGSDDAPAEPPAREAAALARALAAAGDGRRGATWIHRPRRGVPEPALPLWGDVPVEPVALAESGLRFEARLRDARHPGIFLDHRPLREWLAKPGRFAPEHRVLNAFAYTGLLSCAAGLGGARAVWTLDLARPAVEWARANWHLNGLPEGEARFVVDDFFEAARKWARRDEPRFGTIVLDPPSFARGKRGTFSTQRDLGRLHEAAFALLDPAAPGGARLVTSINSEDVPAPEFARAVREAARAAGLRAEPELALGPGPDFPPGPGEAHLKGGIYRVTRAKSSGSGAAIRSGA